MEVNVVYSIDGDVNSVYFHSVCEAYWKAKSFVDKNKNLKSLHIETIEVDDVPGNISDLEDNISDLEDTIKEHLLLIKELETKIEEQNTRIDELEKIAYIMDM